MFNNTTRIQSFRRYELAFSVSDEAQGQVGVRANVTVVVQPVSASAAEGATPVTLEAPPLQVVREQVRRRKEKLKG